MLERYFLQENGNLESDGMTTKGTAVYGKVIEEENGFAFEGETKEGERVSAWLSVEDYFEGKFFNVNKQKATIKHGQGIKMDKYIVNKETMTIEYVDSKYNDGWTFELKNEEDAIKTIEHLKRSQKAYDGAYNFEIEVIEKIEMISEYKSAKQFNDHFRHREVEEVKAVVWEDMDGAYIEIYAVLSDDDNYSDKYDCIAYSKGGDTQSLLKALKKVSKKYTKWVSESWYMDCELKIESKIQYV